MFSQRGESLLDCRDVIGGELRGVGPCVVDLNRIAIKVFQIYKATCGSCYFLPSLNTILQTPQAVVINRILRGNTPFEDQKFCRTEILKFRVLL